MFTKIKEWAAALKLNIRILYFCCRHKDTPLHAKIWLLLVVAYAFSPIDLIPDFIPVLGYLDDLILLPLGIWIAMELVPEDIINECRNRAETPEKILSSGRYFIAGVIILCWLAVIICAAKIILNTDF